MRRTRILTTRTFQIESLDSKKTLKLIYDDGNDKTKIRFKINDFDRVNDPAIIDEKIMILKAIDTEEARKWIVALEIAKVNGWRQIYDPMAFAKLKNKLKLYYNTLHDNFLIYFDMLMVYKPITNIDDSMEFPESEIDAQRDQYYRVPYSIAKKLILEKAEKELSELDASTHSLDAQEIMNKLDRKFPNSININFYEFAKTMRNESFIFNEDGNGFPNEEFVSINVDKIIEIINRVSLDDNCNINIIADYPEEDIIKKIAQHYEKITNPTLRFFFQNVKEKSLGEAMILTYMNFKNIGFGAGYCSTYPQEYTEKVVKLYKSLKKYKIETLIDSLKNNKFLDVEFDDDGNIININPLLENSLLKGIIDIFGHQVEVTKYIL
jgi:hypothetical protein